MPRKKKDSTVIDASPVLAPDRKETDDVMRFALGGDAEVSVDIPVAATLAEVEHTLMLAIKGHERLTEAAERLKPVIGRILLTIQERKLFRPQWKNFTQFIQDRVVKQMGFGRSHAFDALRIARNFPHLKLQEYETYGASRLLLASRITSETATDWREILDRASRQTVEEFRRYVIEVKQDRNAGKARPAVIAIRCSNDTAAAWKKVLEAHPDVPVGDMFQWLLDAPGALRAVDKLARQRQTEGAAA